MTEKISSFAGFRDQLNDPGFLVAKGRFNAPSEQLLRDLLRNGVTTDDSRIVDMKSRIDAERRELERKHVNSLAKAIFVAISSYGYAKVRTIGRNSFYNAGKAIAVASRQCLEKGVRLVFGITFDQGNLGVLRSSSHVSNVTAMLITVEGFAEETTGDAK